MKGVGPECNRVGKAPNSSTGLGEGGSCHGDDGLNGAFDPTVACVVVRGGMLVEDGGIQQDILELSTQEDLGTVRAEPSDRNTELEKVNRYWSDSTASPNPV